jgi:hypothetical protein
MSSISMMAPSITFFISFELKPDVTFSDFTTVELGNKELSGRPKIVP